jgi:hypothetical protein
MAIETIDAATYAVEKAICDKAAAFWKANATYSKGGWSTLDKELAKHPDYAACSNEMRGRVEQFEILRDLPDVIHGYVSSDEKAVTVWTGLPLSTQLYAGKSWKTSGSYVSSTMTQYYAWIGGKQYTGRSGGSGMFIRLKETAESKRRSQFAESNADEMLRHYIAAMLWSTTDESTPEGGEPMDSNYDADDLTDEFRAQCHADCWRFLYRVGDYINDRNYTGRSQSGCIAMAGHDFWMTRNGHGAGFWDGDWKTDARSGLEGTLTRAAKAFGGIDPYITDDGKVNA